MKRAALAALLLAGGITAAFAGNLTPLEKDNGAPALSERKRALFETDAGNFTVEVYPQAAPNAARRFLELVKAGFYDHTPVFRVVPGFVAQFGINWRGDFRKYENGETFKDDPSLFKLDRGTLAFAKSGPDTNSSQVFINFDDNSRLSKQGNFSSFGRVVEGMETVDKFRHVGDPRMGLDQDALWADGDSYLKKLPEQPNMIVKAEVLPEPSPPK